MHQLRPRGRKAERDGAMVRRLLQYAGAIIHSATLSAIAKQVGRWKVDLGDEHKPEAQKSLIFRLYAAVLPLQDAWQGHSKLKTWCRPTCDNQEEAL